MSLSLNDTSTHKGIIQGIERAVYGQDGIGRISDNSTLLKQWTADINLAWDDYLHLALKSSGSRQFDDSNHTDFPFIEADLVANQRTYTYTADENDNLVLDIFKVMIKSSSGTYFELEPIDQQRRGEGVSIWNDLNTTGTPAEYDKTANGIILDVLPDYSWRNATEGERGIKMFINREANYFTYTDTTKMPGCPGIHHEYFVFKPVLKYAILNGLSNVNQIRDEVTKYEGDETRGIIGKIENHFSRTNKDEKKIITMKKINFI